jgi:hemoglobin-like flavoprotein
VTPDQISLVQSSFQRLEPHLPAMATRFYDELFGRDPSLRPLFTIDMAEQRIRFTEKLTEIVWAISDLDELLAHTHALGARHVGYGVRAAHYQTVGAALLDALAGVLGDTFDPATREAWALAYSLVAETMLAGAAAARTPQSE